MRPPRGAHGHRARARRRRDRRMNIGLPITYADVLAAAERLRGALTVTPTAVSHTLSQITGAHVTIKFENLQYTGSFKERGALNRLLALDSGERQRGVVAMS